jgi:hypothetical protein
MDGDEEFEIPDNLDAFNAMQGPMDAVKTGLTSLAEMTAHFHNALLGHGFQDPMADSMVQIWLASWCNAAHSGMGRD